MSSSVREIDYQPIFPGRPVHDQELMQIHLKRALHQERIADEMHAVQTEGALVLAGLGQEQSKADSKLQVRVPIRECAHRN